jgi:hypothetical protein
VICRGDFLWQKSCIGRRVIFSGKLAGAALDFNRSAAISNPGVVARLEIEFGFDPFTAPAGVYFSVTSGYFIQAYEKWSEVSFNRFGLDCAAATRAASFS